MKFTLEFEGVPLSSRCLCCFGVLCYSLFFTVFSLSLIYGDLKFRLLCLDFDFFGKLFC